MPEAPSTMQAALLGLCPQCGARSLFAGVVRFAPRCQACGLDYSRFNVGDGPAAFLTFFLGALIVGLAVALELGAHPPFWVHILLWLPLTVIATFLSLRIAKAAMLALEYRNRAREGRIDRDQIDRNRP